MKSINTIKSKSKSIWTPIFIILFMINAFSSIGMYMSNPIMPDFFNGKGVAFALTGFLSSILSWVSLMFRPFSGWASDSFNQKKMMVISYGVTALCMLLYIYAPNLPFIILVRIIHGLAFGFTATLSLTFAATFIPVENMAEGLANLSLGQLLGSVVGPQLGSMLADNYSISSVFVVSGILNCIAFLLIFFLPYKYINKNEIQRFSFNKLIYKDAIIYLVLICIFSIGNGFISYYLRSFGISRNISNISLFFTINSLAMIAVKPFVSKIHDRKGISYVIYPAFLLSAISMLFLSIANNLTIVIIAAIIKAFGQGVGSPALQAESAKIAGDENRGVAISTCLVGQDIGNIIGPIFGSLMIEASGYQTTFNLLAVFMLIGILLFFIFYSKQRLHNLKLINKQTEV